MRLSEFLRVHSERILSAWDEFASTVAHTGKSMDQRALRDHAAQILNEIADDLDSPQSAAEAMAKSRGKTERDLSSGDSAAETHADTRILAGFGIDAMLTEYRALRASVLRMWAEDPCGAEGGEMQQVTRFNEAIDQAIVESVARYTEQIERSTNLFIGMLGHDIRNPLGTIRLAVELMVRTGQISPRSAQPLAAAAARIQDIVELTVDFSRAKSAAVMPVRLEPGDLGAIFEDVLAETRVRHPSTDFVLKGADVNTAGLWDRGRISQLLSNLLENAVLYGAKGAPVTVTLAAEPGYVCFQVHNRGKVISVAERERIFEPHHRGIADEEHRSSGGLGLGLYICREVVRAHHGTMAVRSTESEGTTFIVRLPQQHLGVPAT